MCHRTARIVGSKKVSTRELVALFIDALAHDAVRSRSRTRVDAVFAVRYQGKNCSRTIIEEGWWTHQQYGCTVDVDLET